MATVPVLEARDEVLNQLRRIIDPDFGQDIVACGFVKELQVEGGKVSLTLELTTPACPIKDEFERDVSWRGIFGATSSSEWG